MATSETPSVGTRIRCTADNLAFKNSNVPAARLRMVGDTWEAQPSDNQTGLIVWVNSPSVIVFDTVEAIEITGVQDRVAFAKALFRSGSTPGTSSAGFVQESSQGGNDPASL